MFTIFREKKPITVTIKLFSGIHRDMGMESYDLGKGITINTYEGVKLKKILTDLGMKNQSSISFFLKTKRVSRSVKLHNGDEVSCLKPSGGG